MEEPLKSTARRAAERKEGTDMEKKRTLPVALQLYSVRGDIDQDFEGTLRAVKDMGYDGVELVGLYGRKPEDVRKAAEAVGLAVAGNVLLDFFMTSCGISCLQSELVLASSRLGMLDVETLRKETRK